MSSGTFNSSAQSTPAVLATGTNGAHGVDAASDSGVGIFANSQSGAAIFANSASGTAISALSQSGFAGKFQGNISVKGNVGIGTEHPTTQLHITGQIATGLSGNSAGAITFFSSDGYAWFHIDNGFALPAGGRPLGRLRFSYGAKPGKTKP